MTDLKNKINTLWPYLVLAAMVLISHGWLLLNKGVYWDDWLIKGFLDDGNWNELRNMTSEMGLPILAFFFWSLKLLGLANSYKLVAFVLILFSSLTVYQIGLRTGWLYRSEALLIALLAAVYPAFQTSILLSTLQYQFFYFIFLVAVLCILISEEAAVGQKQRLFLLSLSFVLFFISFNLNSLLVFYFPFLFFLLFQSRHVRGVTYRQKLDFILRYRFHFVLLPFAYWGIKNIVFPVHGLYVNYNHLRFDGVVGRIAGFIRVVMFNQFSAVPGVLSEYAYFFALVAIVGCIAYLLFWRLRSDAVNGNVRGMDNSPRLKWLLKCGLALLICVTIPYAMAGHVPSTSGWNTRHAVLAGLPMAIILTALIRMIYFLGQERNYAQRLVYGLVAVVLGISCITYFVFCTAGYYATLQLRAIKDESVMAKLRTQVSLKDYSIYWIDDRYPIGGDPYYNFYEWSSMFKSVWGDQSRIGMQLQYAGRPVAHDIPDKVVFSSRYNLADFNPGGRQVCLRIQDGLPGDSKWQLVRSYLFLQAQSRIGLEGKQAEISNLLENATRVEMRELPINSNPPDPLIGCGVL